MPVRTDECNRYAVVQSRYSGPFPCAFLPSTVSDFGQQVGAIRVLVLQNICSDLNKEGIQLCFIPLLKSLRRKQELIERKGTRKWYEQVKEETGCDSPLPSHHDPYPTHLSSDDRLHRSAACHRTRCHYGPSLQSVLRPHRQPVD